MSRKQLTAGRFDVPAVGDVYDRVARHHIQRSLWDQRMSEGKVDWADHDFGFTSEIIDEPEVPEQWGRRLAVCSRCGELRAMYHGVDMRIANIGWCVPPPSRWRRLISLVRRSRS